VLQQNNRGSGLPAFEEEGGEISEVPILFEFQNM